MSLPRLYKLHALLLLLTALLCTLALSCRNVPAKERYDVAKGPAKQIVAPLSASEVFKLRTDCAELAKSLSAEHPSLNPRLTEEQVSHYNPLTNRCYVLLTHSSADLDDPNFYNSEFLYDGQTGEMLAFFTSEGMGWNAKKSGNIFGEGETMIDADPTLLKTATTQNYENYADRANEFITNVMADNRRQ